MKEPIFYNKTGKLTKYALFCGYIDKELTKQGTKQIYIEHNCIHVKAFKITDVSISNEVWNVFEINELTKARKSFKSIK